MPKSLQSDSSDFQQDIKAIDPQVLATVMRGIDESAEEPLLSTFEEGFGYFTSAAVGRSLGQYEFVRNVRMSELRPSPVLIIETAGLGCFLHCVARTVSSS
jgi:hypothetical protein